MEYYFSDKMKALKPSAIREIFKSLGDPEMISFAAGNPSPLSFPVDDLKRIGADIFENSAVGALQYSVTEGYPPLREAVSARMKEKFGIGREGDMTIITSGGQQGMELACKSLCNEGDVVICEDPSFIGSLKMNVFTICSQSSSCPMSYRKDRHTAELSVLSEATFLHEATSAGNWSRSAIR